MKRREAIQYILAASASTIFFAGCKEANVIDFLKEGQLNLDQKHMEYLASISESILPIKGVSDKIGAPVTFIMNMLNDCHSAEEIADYATGFDQYKQLLYGAEAQISTDETDKAIELIKSSLEAEEPQKELIHFINKTKGLSIQNLKSSQYFLTEKTDYALIPGAYEACIEA